MARHLSPYIFGPPGVTDESSEGKHSALFMLLLLFNKSKVYWSLWEPVEVAVVGVLAVFRVLVVLKPNDVRHLFLEVARFPGRWSRSSPRSSA